MYAERAKPRVEAARIAFRDIVAAVASNQLVFCHETGVHIAMMRSTAWAPAGQRAYDVALRNRGKVLTGAIALDGVRATMTVEGGTSKEAFLEFVTQHLIPSLVPGDVVVMDNLGAHHALTVRDALKAANVRTLFLPPYSPDMNPIEQCWSKLKSVVAALRATTRASLEEDVRIATEHIELSDIAGWFRSAGMLTQCE
ncbi:MAG: IS630 family transposase [Deltaproteobacteria bacterium]